ncbi:MAG: hypothetical protein QXT84_06245 [Candidatus Bathyarchaeia archaeon]
MEQEDRDLYDEGFAEGIEHALDVVEDVLYEELVAENILSDTELEELMEKIRTSIGEIEIGWDEEEEEEEFEDLDIIDEEEEEEE